MNDVINAHGSHFPVLAVLVAREVLRPIANVLELGCGSYSTPLLHMLMIGSPPGLLVSADSSPDWLREFGDLKTDWHHFEHVPDWTAWGGIEANEWDVALVDHAPGECRPDAILRLKSRCRFIVVHDTEDEPGPRASPRWQTAPKGGGNYGYGPVFAQFKHVWHWGRYRPDTTVLSDFEACPL